MERTSSPEYLPELLERAASAELRARQDHDLSPQEVRLHLGAGDGAMGTQVLEPIPSHRRIYVELRHVSAFVPRSFKPPSTLGTLGGLLRRRGRAVDAASDSKKYRQVLFDVNGCVAPGEVLALMGPSGSGKTSLLSIMGARAQKMMQVQGEVVFNGRPLSKKLKRQVGFVLQDDLLYESLTVGETLHYAAMLRLPRRMTAADKAARVEAVVAALGLEACRDTIIGGFFRKGISGGERKRTSVGHELLINPSLLFLDEPTSGLDSTTALHLLGVLRGLAAGGRAVVTTIHQPSSRLYQHLDKLLLLSQGHVMYYGAAGGAVSFFDGLGYRLPYGVNVADFILDLASGDVAAGGRDGEASRQFLIERSEAYLKEHPLEGWGAEGQQEGLQVDMRPGSVHSSSSGSTPPSPATPAKPSAGSKALGSLELESSKGQLAGVPSEGVLGEEGEHRWGAPYLSQISILLKRSLRTRRFEAFSVQQVFQILAIAVLAGLFWLQKANKDTVLAARNTLGLLFFELMFLAFRVLFVALFTFPNEHKMMLKERASGMYRLSAFYFARLLSDLPMDFALPTVFICIVYFMGGLRYNGWAFLGNYGANILTMLVAQSLGLWIGSIVMNPKSAQALASVVMLTMVLTGGFFVVNLPAWISWLKYTSFIYYALGLLLYIEFEGGSRTLYSCVEVASASQCTLTDPDSPETSPACTPVGNLQQALGLVQNPSSQGDAIRDACVLLGFLLVFRLAVYWTLRKKTRS